MTDAGLPMAPLPDAPSWTVPIDMPVWEKGKKAGKPVGWMTSNRTSEAEGKWAKMELTEARRLWRQAAFTQYMLPRHRQIRLRFGTGRRVHLTFQWGFVNGTHPDVSNLGDTTKPIIDALQPDKTVLRKRKLRGGGFKLDTVRHLGIGMIPDDNHLWVVLGAQQPLLPYLGRGPGIGGRVLITITPLPAQTLDVAASTAAFQQQ